MMTKISSDNISFKELEFLCRYRYFYDISGTDCVYAYLEPRPAWSPRPQQIKEDKEFLSGLKEKDLIVKESGNGYLGLTKEGRDLGHNFWKFKQF